MTRIKICGLTREQDIDAAIGAGADAIGLVLANSPRRLSPARAAELAAHVGGRALTVGVFLGAGADEVRAALENVALDWLQFHGDETAAFCASFGLPWLKAVTAAQWNGRNVEKDWPGAAGFLVDSHEPGGRGGTGRAVEWSSLATSQSGPALWLAGGLTPDNVAAAIAAVRPHGVDVSSGVERAPGVKDADAIFQFVQKARSVS